MAPLKRIGVLGKASVVASQQALQPQRRRSRLSDLWRRPRRTPPPLPPAPPSPEISAQDVERLVLAAASNSADALLTDLYHKLEGRIDVTRPREGATPIITFRDLTIGAGTDGFAALNFRGVDEDIALRFRDCQMDVLDFSYAKLHSIEFRGCGPSATSPFAKYGMQIFANGLRLTGDFYMDRTSKDTRVMILHAPGIKAREIQLLSGTQFNGGNLARDIWDRLLIDLKTPAKNPYGLGVIGLIETYVIAARGVLKTVDLRSSEVDTIFLSIQSHGIVDLHDAHVKLKLLLEAGVDGRCWKVDFSPKFGHLTDLLSVTHRRPRQQKDETAAQFLYEAWKTLNGRLSPALDLAGLRCDGELRFDGYDDDGLEESKPDSAKKDVPPVRGHVNLANAKCRIFTDDGSWWDYGTPDNPFDRFCYERFGYRPICHVTFELNCFEYEFFGISPRFLFDTDPALRPFDSPRWSLDPIIAESTAEAERKLALDGGYWASAARICKMDKNFEPKDKSYWLDLNPRERRAEDVPRTTRDPLDLRGDTKDNGEFDAQPWTQCARAMRRAGWREPAEEILRQRENKIHQKLHRYRFIDDVLLLASLSFLFLGVVSEFDSLAPAYAHYSFHASAGFAALLGSKWLFDRFLLIKGDRQGPKDRVRSLWYRLLRWTIAYGYRPTRALVQAAVLVLLGAMVFNNAMTDGLLDAEPEKSAAATMRVPVQFAAELDVETTASALVEPFLMRAAVDLRYVSSADYRDCDDADRAACEKDPPRRQEAPSKAAPPPSFEGTATPEVEEPSLSASIINLDKSVAALSAAAGALQESLKKGHEVHFNAFMYSLDVFFPFVELRQADYWLPGDACAKQEKPPTCSKTSANHSEDREADVFLVWLAQWLLIAAGWWYSSVLVASLTGFLDRKE